MKIGSMFSGCDGLALGVQMVTLAKVAWHVEIDVDACRVLDSHWRCPNLGDVSLVDWSRVEPVDLIVGGFPCFPAGTPIETESGHVPIEDVREGMKVWTHKNRLQTVKKVMRRQAAPLVEVRAMGCAPMPTTAEHPYYARTLHGEPDWVHASDLRRGHFLAQPLGRPPMARNWETSEFWYVVGRWLGDGWVVTSHRPDRVVSKVHKAIICCAHDEADELAARISAAGMHATRAPEASVVKFHISSRRLVEFLHPFGRGAAAKRIPSFVWRAPQTVLEALWQGLVDSDGHVYETGLVSITTVSSELARDAARLARLVHGKPAAVYYDKRPRRTIIEGREVSQRDSYTVRVSSRTDKSSGFIADGFAWVPVRSVKDTETTAEVFNFEVEEDNSYVAHGVVVHNCQDISVSGKGEGIEGARSGLWKSIKDAVRTLRPHLVYVENVSALLVRGFEVVAADLAEVGYRFVWARYSSAAIGAPHPTRADLHSRDSRQRKRAT